MKEVLKSIRKQQKRLSNKLNMGKKSENRRSRYNKTLWKSRIFENNVKKR